MKKIILPLVILLLLAVAAVAAWYVQQKKGVYTDPDLVADFDALEATSEDFAGIGTVYGTEGAPDAVLAEADKATENTAVNFPTGHIFLSGVTRANLFSETVPLQSFMLDVAGNANAFVRSNLPDDNGHVEFINNEAAERFFASKQGISRFHIFAETEALASPKPLTGAATEFLRSISYADATERLSYAGFMADPLSERGLLNLADWNTFIYNVSQEQIEAEIAHAYAAVWLPDGETLLFLRTDGLYSAHVTPATYAADGAIATKAVVTEAKVLGVKEGQVIATSMIAVSADGARLIWTVPKLGLINIFALEQTGDKVTTTLIEQQQNTEREYYWPHFAADGEFYTVQAVDDQETKAEGVFAANPELEIRKVGVELPVRAVSLREFNFGTLFIDDWRS